jgi:hypothetical protein
MISPGSVKVNLGITVVGEDANYTPKALSYFHDYFYNFICVN